MKTKLLLFVLALSPALSALSQLPQGFNYQAIARNSEGNPITGATIKVKLSVLSDTNGFYSGTGGTYIWEEEHTGVKTNTFGLFTVVLGDPSATKSQGSAGSFSAIDWSPANLFIGTKVANPTDYKVMGSTKLWSVPYALKAKETDQWVTSGSDIYRSSGNVGIGIIPAGKLHVNGDAIIEGAIAGQSSTGFGPVLKIGNDSKLADINMANTMGVIGLQDETNGGIQLGSTGPTIFGSSGSLTVYGNKMVINDGTSLAGTLKLTGHSWIGSADWGDLRLASGINSGSTSIRFITEGEERAYITGTGSMGVGIWPTQKLHVAGNALITGNLSAAFLGSTNMEIGGPAPSPTNGQATFYFHHYSALAHQLRYTAGNFYLEAAGNGYGTTPYPTLQIGGGLYAALNGGNIGFGTTASASKVAIQPPSGWADDVPLFEVKNKHGYPVLAVYNNGVRILVEDVDGKGGLKSGFAIGGFDQTKAGQTYDLMTVSPDSIRLFIDNTELSKGGRKGGFAIGSFDATKAGVNDKGFMHISTEASTTLGNYNTFLGYEAGLNMKGAHNTLIGKYAGKSTTGNGAAANIFIGEGAGMNNSGGYLLYANPFPGGGYINVFNSWGGENVAIGYYSGIRINGSFLCQTCGKGNVLLGNYTGYNLTTGSKNTIIGYLAGYNLETGENNVFIGNYAGYSETTSNKLYIDNSSTTSPLIYGDFYNNMVKINGWLEVEDIFSELVMRTKSGAAGRKSYISLFGTFGPGATDLTARNFASIEVGSSDAGWSGAYFRVLGRVNDGDPFETMRINTANGNFFVSANAYKPGGGSWLNSSDARLKDIHETFRAGLSEILKLEPYYFNYKEGNERNHSTEKEYIGFIAQDVENSLPEAVSKGEDGYLNLDMHVINVALVNAVKEQQLRIEKLEKIVEELQKVVEGR